MSQINQPIGKHCQIKTNPPLSRALSLSTYLIDLIAVDLTDVIGPRLGLLDHLQSDWGKHAILSPLPAKVSASGSLASLSIVITAEAAIETCRAAKTGPTDVGPWVEEACVLTRELYKALKTAIQICHVVRRGVSSCQLSFGNRAMRAAGSIDLP